MLWRKIYSTTKKYILQNFILVSVNNSTKKIILLCILCLIVGIVIFFLPNIYKFVETKKAPNVNEEIVEEEEEQLEKHHSPRFFNKENEPIKVINLPQFSNA